MLKVLGLDNESGWQDIVKGFTDYDVYYLPQYTKAFHLHGDGEPLLLFYENDNVRAINVVMKRDIALSDEFQDLIPVNTYFDLSTPYGYGGFLIEGGKNENTLRQLNSEYTEYCRDNGNISEFVRFHPLLKNYSGLEPIYELIEMGKTIYIDLASPEVIDANIRPHTHNRIRKACRDCLGVYYGNSKELFAQFSEMYLETMIRAQAQPYYMFDHAFFENIRCELQDNATIFYTVCDKQVAAMELVLHCNHKMHSHLQASKKEYQQFSPVPLMIYNESLWGCHNGYRALHMGGGLGSREDSIYQFKSNFNKDADSRFFTGRKIFDQEKYDYLLRLRNQTPLDEKPAGYFPEYRA